MGHTCVVMICCSEFIAWKFLATAAKSNSRSIALHSVNQRACIVGIELTAAVEASDAGGLIRVLSLVHKC